MTTTTTRRIVRSAQTAELLLNHFDRNYGALETLARYTNHFDFHKACEQLVEQWNASYDCVFDMPNEEETDLDVLVVLRHYAVYEEARRDQAAEAKQKHLAKAH